jgi:hypothetical protein
MVVEAYGLNDWKGLEELLSVNDKKNHGFTELAFVDLVLILIPLLLILISHFIFPLHVHMIYSGDKKVLKKSGRGPSP